MREIAKKHKKQTKILAPINMQNVLLAQQHDRLTLLEQVFTERRKELHEHLWVTTSELYKITHNSE